MSIFSSNAQAKKGVRTDSPSVPVEAFDAQKYFKHIHNLTEGKYVFNGTTKADFERWQKALREELKVKLGLQKLENELAGYKPTAKQIDSEDIGYALRQRWVIWTEPDVPLTMVVMIPKNIEGKRPLMITPHGHGKNTENYAGIYDNEEERKSGEEGERDVAVQAAKNGFVAIAPAARGFGITRTNEDKKKDATSSCRDYLVNDILVGRTPIGDRVWDISRIIDWAIDNLPVDADKIIVSGNSGGGTITLFAGACDTRIAASLPASYFCTFKGSIGSMYHCECNYIPGILELGEMADIAGLTAPRLFCAIHGTEDNIFPIDETRKAFSHLQTIYKAAGVPDNCELYEGDGGHRYYKKGAWDFIFRHFDK